MASRTEKLQNQLSALTEEYVRQLPQRIKEIDEIYQKLMQCPDDLEIYKNLRLQVHKLAGSGATFGFDAITASGRTLEVHLSNLVESGLLETNPDEQHIGIYLTQLKKDCNLNATSYGVKRAESQMQKFDSTILQRRHRNIVIFSMDRNRTIGDLSDQLGFFGFSVSLVSDIKGFRKAINDNANQLAIINTDVIEKSKRSAETLSNIKQQHPNDLSYIFFSERTDLNSRLSALRAGGEAYFIIPFDLARLLDMIDSLNAEEELVPFHVLIVDDDPDQVSYYALILQQAGMITSVASEPKTVLNVLVEAKPELILMDMYMPGCSGPELLSIIRQQETFVGIPVVFLSVEDSEVKKMAAVTNGGDDFITKPAEPELLIASITNRIMRTRNIRYFMERDSLTGLLNHSNLKEQLIREKLRAERTGNGLCFAMIDLDLFKGVNDTYGHLNGDKVLKSLCRILVERLRRTDIIGRYGGEEFGVILLNTDVENAERVLNEIRENFSRVRHQAVDEEFFVTFSCGIASYPEFADADRLTREADRALYAAKEKGRNLVIVASAEENA